MTDDPTIFEERSVETGLVTATVNPGLTPAGKQAAKALVQMPPFTAGALAKMARDVAMDVMLWPEFLTKHQITQAQYDYLAENNDFFKGLLTTAVNEWQGIKGTKARVEAQSLAAYEELLPVIAGRMGQASEKLVDVVEGAKLLAKTGGLDANAGGSRSGGEGFTISIDLGADTKLTIGPPQAPAQGPGPDGSVTISTDAKRPGQQQPIQAQLEGPPRTGAVRPLPAGESPPGASGPKP